MPGANPHTLMRSGQPAVGISVSVVAPGARSAASVVCAAVAGTLTTVIVSVLNISGGSLRLAPRRNGITGGIESPSGPDWPPTGDPAPAATNSRISASTPTRSRCCTSTASDCAANALRAGLTIATTVPTTVIVSARATVSSTTEKPLLRLHTSRRLSTDRDEMRTGRRTRRQRRRTLFRRRDDDLNDERARRRGGERLDRPA